MKRFLFAAVIAAFQFSSFADLLQDVKSFTSDKPAKFIWTHETTNAGSIGWITTYSKTQILLGYSTTKNAVDTICKDVSNYQRPMITHDGNKIVFSYAVDSSVYTVNWDGTNKQKIAKGIAGALWYDVINKKDYIIYAKDAGLTGKASIYMRAISDTTDSLLLSSTVSGFTNCIPTMMGISSNLKYLAVETVWPANAIFDLTAKASLSGDGGCYTTMPYDTTGRYVFYETSHTAIKTAKPGLTTVTYPFISAEEATDGKMGDALKMATYNPTIICMVTHSANTGSNGSLAFYKIKPDSLIKSFIDTLEPNVSAGKAGYSDFWVLDTIPTNAQSISSNQKSLPSFKLLASSIILPQHNNAALTCQVFSLNGKHVRTVTLNANSNSSIYSIESLKKFLLKGMYTISVQSNNQQLGTARLSVY